jgi:hypothetical protein
MTPTGQRIAGYIGQGTLRVGAGKIVQRTQQPLHCGAIVGAVMGYEDIETDIRGTIKKSTRFDGDFLAFSHTGELIGQGMQCFLPKTVERGLKAALRQDPGAAISVAIEVWCEPDPEGRAPSPLGYQYVAYNRRPRASDDPVLRLAYAAGIMEPPKQQLAAPAPEPAGDLIEVADPETGEVTTMTQAEAAAAGLAGPAAPAEGKPRQRRSQAA